MQTQQLPGGSNPFGCGIPQLFNHNGKWYGADGQPVDADVAEWLNNERQAV